ncbi:MAG: peptidase M14 [Planctomycetes bacterium]|nr:peptidase M14 [Planctomycetota bacterium]
MQTRRPIMFPISAMVTLFLTSCVSVHPAMAQPTAPVAGIPTPISVIGHEVGADYKLARWEKIVEYFDKLGAASDRVHVRRLDETTEGNPYLFVEISSADTVRNLAKYRTLQHKLADPRLLAGDADRKATLQAAKTTIVVTCGLHSNECAGSQMAMELAFDLANRNDARTREILDNCIILLVPSANPDGNNKIVDWYEQYIGTPFEGGRMPWLYQKYAGHDNNRDWFMLNLKEIRTLTKVLYHEWYPTISYDIHQMGNRGARFFVPPFFDPVNPNVDALIHQSLLLIGGHMATELQENGKTGVIYKAIFDNWWQGGNRTTPYRHNIVGILTEAASANMASPIFQEYRDLRGGGRGFPSYQPAVNFPDPWPGGWWRLRDIVDYEKIACNGLFTLAARYRDRFVRNHLSLSEKALKKGSEEPPFAWLVPPDQRDPAAAAQMLEILRLSGIEVHSATEPFTADGIEYPLGTYVLLASQPFRPHLKDMMERQLYPDRREYKDGPAESPYDAAGWTLPLQMGVTTVEAVMPFAASLERVEKVEARKVVPPGSPITSAYITKRQSNNDYRIINALLADGFDVSVLSARHEEYSIGSIVVTGGDRAEELTTRIRQLTKEIPGRFAPLLSMPQHSNLRAMTLPRTGLYQPWTSSMDEGWTRYTLEQFDFPYTTIHNPEIRAGNLRDRLDCIIVPDQSLDRLLDGVDDKDMPPPYAGGIGQDGAMQLERFVEQGGTLVLMDSATDLATDLFHVPVRNALDGLPRDKFFCPGSLLRIRVDNTHPLGYGFDTEASANFVRSQAFEIGEAAFAPLKSGADKKLDSDATTKTKTARTLTDAEIKKKVAAQPVASVATYADNLVLQSGWILGEDYVRTRSAVCEVAYGKGRIVLFGFRVQYRGQPHNTFKFLFNAIYRSTLADAAVPEN